MHSERTSSGGVRPRKYPIGLQSFRKIREGGYRYVDKTEVIHQLVNSGSYYFLSRPRRFGKSLLVDTLHELFSGSRELFEGLWIENHWDWSRKNPVIHLRISQIPYQQIGLHEALYKELDVLAAEVGVTLAETNLKGKFRELIQKASANGQVVILIDEYDKPLVDYLDNPERLTENRSVFKEFYSVLKDADRYIRLLFITGVSRFSRVSIFSDLNNLEDISIGRNFHALAGISQEELERDFAPEIADMQREQPDVLADIKEWYNGYSWGGPYRLYNPFSLLNLMKSREFMNYWYTTGTPTFLFEQLKKRKLGDMDGIEVSANTLADFNTDNPNMASLLFQTGYLTIKSVEDQIYELGYPNREVKESLLDGLLNTYREPVLSDSLVLVTRLRKAINTGNIKALITTLDSLIGQIPYDHWRGDTESIFNIITVLTFRLAGVEVHTEVHSARGRCDVLVKTGDYLYVMELKLDGTAQEALDQILASGYLQPYGNDPRKKIALGIAFSSADRCVAEYLELILENGDDRLR